MPTVTNKALLNYYDHSTQTQVPNQQAEAGTPEAHHAMHCLIFEVLRGWMGTGLTVAEYNNMEEVAWLALRASVCAAAVIRAKLNPASAADAARLTANDLEAACNIGDNYFEHGYTTIIDGTPAGDRLNFTREGGVN
jgi:hypothetical protein